MGAAVQDVASEEVSKGGKCNGENDQTRKRLRVWCGIRGTDPGFRFAHVS